MLEVLNNSSITSSIVMKHIKSFNKVEKSETLSDKKSIIYTKIKWEIRHLCLLGGRGAFHDLVM